MNDTLDRWIQRATLTGLLALAATLATVGATLYVHRDPPAASSAGTP
ncbi:hypothetical protein HRD49_06515 [Corallococcus exiguus]|nr:MULTISPECIES: hypothetical protein [Corallococcus]MBN8466619.1 hypothetical protein [Corallococcus exiguus]NNB87897.1 hypothetical protein [Corallococcus exiguus]NNB94970.1 hypothetical protein [Corallococcus exiguus]NNC05322.1 hypothetical protein [Corallococcus exiguus]NNC17123.1 hypothetical protein [Corallococcus exiguus]